VIFLLITISSIKLIKAHPQDPLPSAGQSRCSTTRSQHLRKRHSAVMQQTPISQDFDDGKFLLRRVSVSVCAEPAEPAEPSQRMPCSKQVRGMRERAWPVEHAESFTSPLPPLDYSFHPGPLTSTLSQYTLGQYGSCAPFDTTHSHPTMGGRLFFSFLSGGGNKKRPLIIKHNHGVNGEARRETIRLGIILKCSHHASQN